MSDKQWVWNRKFTIPSNAGAGRRVQQVILEQLRRHQWDEHDLFCVHLATEEALVNAIKHGNHYDADKRVRIRCRVSPALVRIEVADEGPGFDLSQVPDPRDPCQLESPCGRGIMLMRSFMSRVQFNKLGNQVILEKERAGSRQPLSGEGIIGGNQTARPTSEGAVRKH